MRAGAIVGIGVALVAAALVGAYFYIRSHHDPMWVYADRLEVLRQSFRDPDSVKWKSISPGAHNILCGFVNAKNGMGGYTGFTPFYAMPEALAVTEVDTGYASPDQSTDEGREKHREFSTWESNCVKRIK